MKYELSVAGKTFEVDYIEFGVLQGSPEGNIDLYIRVADNEEDIYTDSKKKAFWTKWIDDCCMDKYNPEDRIREVKAVVKGGEGDAEVYRTIEIRDAYMSRYRESSTGTSYSYDVTLQRGPRKAGADGVKVAAG